MLGSFAVGKTSLVARFVKSVFDEKYHSTIGVKIDKKAVELPAIEEGGAPRPVTLILWDLEGEDDLVKVQMTYLRGAAGYLLVVDGTRPESLETAVLLRRRIEHERGVLPYVLMLNKFDLEGGLAAGQRDFAGAAGGGGGDLQHQCEKRDERGGGIFGAHEGGDGMNDHASLVACVLRSMGLLVALRCEEAETGFRWLGEPPPWAESFGCVPGGECDLVGAFAFMDMFVDDADAFWDEGRDGARGEASLHSAPWSEPDDAGVIHQLEAVALRLSSPAADVIAIAGAGADFSQTQSILQAARERRLAVDRELAVQRQVEQQLRLRVEQRTAELARTNEQLRTMGSEVALAEQRERHRLAVGLHDHVGQLLAAAKLQVGAQRIRDQRTGDAGADRAAALTEVLDVLGQAIDATRTLTFELSPPMLYELGLMATLASLVDQVSQRHPGVACTFRDAGETSMVGQDAEVVLFQVVRELISNALKHGQPSRLVVDARREGRELVLTVTDDGVGFDVAKLAEPVVGAGGFGLFTVRERLEQLGGRLEVESAVGSGTTARVVVLPTPDG